MKQQLCQTYLWLRQYGINDSHSGNASVRDGDMFWVTPTGACADTLKPEQLIACQVHGDLGAGASNDARLHQLIYQTNADTGCVLHSHGPYSLALTMDGQNFVPIDFEGYFYFPVVPVIDVAYDDYFSLSQQAVPRVLAEHPIMVTRGHGIYACAPDINLAYKWTCSFEQSAKTAHIARMAKTVP